MSFDSLNFEFFTGVFHRRSMLATCIPRTYRKSYKPSILVIDPSLFGDAVNQSAQLVSLDCKPGIWRACLRIGKNISFCLEGLGCLDTVGLVVYMVAYVVGWSRCACISGLKSGHGFWKDGSWWYFERQKGWRHHIEKRPPVRMSILIPKQQTYKVKFDLLFLEPAIKRWTIRWIESVTLEC